MLHLSYDDLLERTFCYDPVDQRTKSPMALESNSRSTNGLWGRRIDLMDFSTNFVRVHETRISVLPSCGLLVSWAISQWDVKTVFLYFTLTFQRSRNVNSMFWSIFHAISKFQHILSYLSLKPHMENKLQGWKGVNIFWVVIFLSML